MIKKIKLKYFESHEDAEIDFTKGLNLIVGQSNSGKSALIRALSLIARNDFDKDCVRVGHTYCQVTVQTENGWVECQRGQGINKWRTFDGKEQKEYRNIGSIVPDEVPIILGIGEKNRGQIKEMPNFMFQLQKHYMLAQIDGKKATSNLVARMMDNAIGLGGMQDLIKDLATDLAKDKKKLNELNSNISELKSNIVEQSIFDNYSKLLAKCRNLNKEIKESQESFEKANNSYVKLKKLNEELKKLSCVDIDLDLIEKQLFEIEEKNKIIRQFVKVKNSLCEYEYLNDFNVDFQNDINILQTLSFRINKLQQLQKSLRSKLNIFRGLKVKITANDNRMKDIQEKFEILKKDIGYCPLCERKFE